MLKEIFLRGFLLSVYFSVHALEAKIEDTKEVHVTFEQIKKLTAKPPDFKLTYGSDSKQFVELRLPAGKGPFPVLFMIHGGCWLDRIASFRYMEPLADALRDKGYATVNIEYRCVDNKGGGWPGSFLDIADAIDSVKKLAEQFPLDKDRVMTIGHSAGGFFALWALARYKLSKNMVLFRESPQNLLGAISLGGSGDLENAYDHTGVVCGPQVVPALLGGTPTEAKENYKIGSPVNLLPLARYQIFITGEGDKAVPIRFGDEYVEKAKKVGNEQYAVHIRVPNCGHFEYVDPNTKVFSIILSNIERVMKNIKK